MNWEFHYDQYSFISSYKGFTAEINKRISPDPTPGLTLHPPLGGCIQHNESPNYADKPVSHIINISNVQMSKYRYVTNDMI